MNDTDTESPWKEAGVSGPGLLLCHPWWGISPGILKMAESLASAGFVVVVPDLYAGRTASTIEDAQGLRALFPLAVRQERFNAAVQHLLEHDGRSPGPVGVIGLSMGAAWALSLAATQPGIVAAAVLYYGTGDPDETPDWPLNCLGHFAENDEWEPQDGVVALRDRLVAAGGSVEFHTYPGTSHWFAEADVTSAYDPVAAELAMARTIAFLTTHVPAGSGRQNP